MDEALARLCAAPEAAATARPPLATAQLPIIAALVCLQMSALAAGTDDPAEGPGRSEPDAAPSSSPQAAEAARWLERIEAKHKLIKTLTGTVKYDHNQLDLGDSQRRFGKLVYVAGPPPKFAVHFDRVVINRYLRNQDRWYIFDGTYMAERLHDRKQFFRRRLVPPDSDRKVQSTAGIGQGPLLVPLPIRKDDLTARYEIHLVPPAEDDPQGVDTIHLRLAPKTPGQSKFTKLDLWHDRETLLPVKARTVDGSNNESIVWLETDKAIVNGPVDEKLIDTALPTELDGWQVEDIPYQGPPAKPASETKTDGAAQTEPEPDDAGK